LVPSRIEDTGRVREHYYEKSLKLIEEICGESIHEEIAFKKTMAHSDFESEYGTFRGKAFGWMSNHYRQNRKNKKITNSSLQNLFYGEFPVLAGLGVSSAILGGEMVAGELMRTDRKTY
jgi:phytoene desaturase